jgi:hypothetical protein
MILSPLEFDFQNSGNKSCLNLQRLENRGKTGRGEAFLWITTRHSKRSTGARINSQAHSLA